jgi:predicted Zn-dependent peptidase
MLAPSSSAQNLTDFAKRVTEFKLDNGLKFIAVERHEAPVAAFYTYADAGSVDEVKGITGLAHLFEHMAFKGTTTVGTKDLTKELEAIQKEDEAFERLRREQNKGALADTAKVKQLTAEFEAARKAAQELVVSNEIGEAIDRAGGVGLNASTSWDATDYYYSLPSNKLELWFTLESDRFLNPVLREFYVERDVVMEERRLRTESQPFGRLIEEFFSIAYKAHPYGEPIVGHMSDLKTVTRAEAEAFFKKYYGANNLTMAVVGDINPGQVKQLAQTYFARLPVAPKPDPVETVEPEQLGERRVIVEDKAQPIVIVGYHKGNIHHPDDAAFSVLSEILGRGRTSRLYKTLVKDKKIAIEAASIVGYPGAKYPNLMLMYAVTSQGHTAEDCEAAIYEEIERLKNEPVAAAELQKAKTRLRADLIRELNSNTGIAGQVAFYQAVTGDWRNLFRRLDQINAVSAADVQRVAQQYLIAKHRTVAAIKTVDGL